MVANVNINEVNLPQSLDKVSKNKIYFKGNGNNKLERTSQNDTVQISSKKDHTIRNILIGTTIATGLAIAGDFVFAKGKHVKKLIGKGEEAAKKDSKKLTDDVGKTAKKEEGFIDKGAYGQDLNDPLDPANKLDPLSPHYEGNGYNKGAYGQDLYDPTHPMNKYDVSSPYYDNSVSGGYDGMGGSGSSFGGDGFGGGYGSGFGY